MKNVKLNQEQQSALEQIKQGGNYIILGNAGTGKSTLLRQLHDAIPEAVFVAPTGAAARLINGVTINSLFRIPPQPYITEWSMGVISNKSTRKTIKAIKVLVVDEISLVRSDIFAAIDYRLRQYAPDGCSHLPFGGRQIILCGDFFQLPPVVTDTDVCGSSVGELLERELGGIYPFNTALWFQAKITPLYLRTNMRQTGDKKFQECLDSFRCDDENRHQEALELLNRRVTTEFPADAVYLCPRKSEANAINDRELKKLQTPDKLFTAIRQGDYGEDYPVDAELRLKLQERVIVTVNLSGDVTNGTIGIVSGFLEDGVILSLADGREVQIAPHEFKKISYRLVRDPATGEERPVPFETGCFRQLPLRPGYALTIHKAQGMTLNSVVLNRGNRGCFSHGQCYVGISRVRKLEDLHLVQPLSLSDIIVAPEVLMADRLFRDNQKLWTACVKECLEELTAEEKGYISALNHYAAIVFEDIAAEYQRRFNTGEEFKVEVKPYFEYLCRELFLFHIGQKNIDLLQTFAGLLKNL